MNDKTYHGFTAAQERTLLHALESAVSVFEKCRADTLNDKSLPADGAARLAEQFGRQIVQTKHLARLIENGALILRKAAA